jgi:hypothetical protein
MYKYLINATRVLILIQAVGLPKALCMLQCFVGGTATRIPVGIARNRQGQ